MEKKRMISPNGVKANMCCTSCRHNTIKKVGTRYRAWRAKKSECIASRGNMCGFYVMADFFRNRGYKPMAD